MVGLGGASYMSISFGQKEERRAQEIIGNAFTINVCGTFASLLGCGLNQFILAQWFARQGMVSVVIGAMLHYGLCDLFPA